MPTQIHIKHPLRSNGSSQLSRLVKALSPTHFRLDERSSQDLINAAYQYAQMLRYHSPDSPAGDNWACFWEIENLTYMAILAALDTDQIRQDYEKIDLEFGLALEGQTNKKGKKSNSELEGQYFRLLLRYTRDTARRLERHYQTLREDIPLKGELLTLIRRDNDKRYDDPKDIEGALQQLIAWHKAWDDHLDFKAYRAFFQDPSRWGVRNLDEYHCILPDDSLNERDEIRGLFLRFFNALVAIKTRAQQLFDAESARLELPEDQDPRPIAPHIALFITFLNLFRHAQDSLNEIPQRHLDFYYDQVLCLQRRPADPDHAYLIFTLAKEFNNELVEKGTTLLAGKDDKGQPIKFETLEQWKVTRAEVVEVKGLNWSKGENKLLLSSKSGDLIVKEKEAFRGFADGLIPVSGTLGFAIASPQLILKEGERTIKLIFQTSAPLANDFFTTDSISAVSLTTDEGWKKIINSDAPSQARYVVQNNENNVFTISISLPRDYSPIVRLEELEEIYGFGPSEWPMVLVNVAPEWINEISVEEIMISVDVVGVREHLIIQTDQGVFDGVQTVYPFGPTPKIGNRFYLGSTEIFQKALSDLNVRFTWIAPPPNPPGFLSYYEHYTGYNSRNFPNLKIEFVDKATERESGVEFQVAREGILSGDTIFITVITPLSEPVDKILVKKDGIVNGLLINKKSGQDFFELQIPNTGFKGSLEYSVEDHEKRFNPVYFNLFQDGIISQNYDLFLNPKTIATEIWTEEIRIRLLNPEAVPANLSMTIEGQAAKTPIVKEGIAIFDVTTLPHKFTLKISPYTDLEITTHNFSEFDVFFQEPGSPLPPDVPVGFGTGEDFGTLNITLLRPDTTDLKFAGIPVIVNGVRYHTNDKGKIAVPGITDETVWSVEPSFHPNFQQISGTVSDKGPKDITITLWPINISYITEIALQDTQLVTVDFRDTELQIWRNNGNFFALTEASTSNDKRRVVLPIPELRNYLVIQNKNFQIAYTDFTDNQLYDWYIPSQSERNNSKIAIRLHEKITKFSMIQNERTIQDNFDVLISSLNLKRDTRTQYFEKYTPTLKRGFIRMVLAQNDFLHTEYIKLLANPDLAKLINPPYTPSSNGISVDYKSTQSIINENDRIDKFYLIHPYGGFEEVSIYEPKKPIPFTPSFYPNVLVKEVSNLFIGLELLIPGDTLSLLIQLSEGSEQNFDALPPAVEWFYLSKNEWKPLGAEKIISDSTFGLRRTGLIQFAIPRDASNGNTVLDAKYHWLSAKVVEGTGESIGAFASIKSIRAQALEAVFAPTERSYLTRLEKPLDALTISKLETSRSAVKKVEQPFASFGGRKPETDPGEYHRRVSERLRHKDRAITAWDYEHLLLEQYGLVAVAKCIPHTRYEASGEYLVPSELAPGFVSLAVVPDLLRRPNMVREEPRFSRGDLNEMRDFLLPKANLFLQPQPATENPDDEDHFLQVVNPQYEPIHIALRVWLRRGADQHLAKYQINEALRRYLAPWLYDATQGPTFGRDIRRSKLVQLIENLDAVDVIQELKVYQSATEKFPTNSQPLDGGWEAFEVPGTVIKPQTARSILTTVSQHQIEIATDNTGGTVAPRMVSGPPLTSVSEKKEAAVPPKIESKTARKVPAKVTAKSKPSTSNRK